ncbi:MAG: serine/threonine-protein kinase [Luteimonas sp.]
MDAERWQRLSPLLDAMLELDPRTRAENLVSLRIEDPQLAADLEELMALEIGAEDFLSEPLVAPLPGARPDASVGPYRLERMLGEGGMGQVWLARRDDGLYQRRVALKLLRPGFADTNLRLRFTRERQILARLEHPHIARLLDAGISGDNQPYLALEYVEGEAITDWCHARALELDKRLRLFLQVCEAVSHAHANLIVHRDLKPSNILVTALDEVRLLDFGIAKLLDSADQAPDNTRTGLRAAFTLHYAAPEQIRGEPVTTMTDVYSLGVVLYELLTDAKPYRLKRQTDAEWEEAILQADPMRPSLTLQRNADGDNTAAPALRRRARALVGDLDNIVLKTLAKRPEQRYPSVEALALDLQRYLDGKPVMARAQSVAYRTRKYASRHRWALATTALIAVVLTTALGIVAWQAQQAVQEASRAQALQDFVVGLFENAGSTPDGTALDVRQLLDAGIERGNRELARQPVARAELFGVIARLRLGLGDNDQALSLLKRQAAIVAAIDAPSSLRLESVTDLGRAQRITGQAAECTQTMRSSQTLARREQQQLPVQAAEFYSEFGRCHRALGQRNTARQLFQRALGLRRDPLMDNAGVAESLADLAGLRADAGDAAGALQAYQGALQHLRSTVGARHPLAVELQRNIAALYSSQGNAAAAETAYRRALSLSDDLLGPRHPDNLALHRQLASLFTRQGRYAEAAEQLDAAHAWLLQRFGPRDQRIADSLDARARIAWERDDLSDARKMLEQSLAIRRSAPGHALLPATLSEYAALLRADGRDSKALVALAEMQRLRVARLGADHPLLSDGELQTGDILAKQGNVQAQAHLQHARALAASGDRARAADLSLARWMARNGQADEAMPRLANMAMLGGNDDAARNLRWRARAYRAEARCTGDDAAQAVAELDALIAELAVPFPEGGVLSREVASIRARCAPITT